jgi:curved DNA-binding protein CbpA
MQNFYAILGIQETAGLGEIKSAFRKLAKMYHPDKNPGGQEEFRKILRAYETLSDPSQKRAYDLKLKYHRGVGGSQKEYVKKTGTKKWTFEEKDLKRRKYYDEHIKRYEKHTGKDPRVSEVKKNYNEYKYILFATPLAVALFLLVVNLATGSQPRDHSGNLSDGKAAKKEMAASIAPSFTLKMGDSPYTDHFGRQQYDTQQNRKLVVKNQSGKDVILCVFTGKEFVRSCFIQDGFFAEIPQLPVKNLTLKYMSGKNWNGDTLLNDPGIYGSFKKDLSFFAGAETGSGSGDPDELTLLDGINQGFKKIDQTTFFNKN